MYLSVEEDSRQAGKWRDLIEADHVLPYCDIYVLHVLTTEKYVPHTLEDATFLQQQSQPTAGM